MTAATILLTTEQGRKNLGSLLKYFRERKKWSLDDIYAEILAKTGHSISKSALSALERGNSEPRWNTLSILSASGIYFNPQTGKPFTTSEFFEIACEKLQFEIHLEIKPHPCD